MNIIELAFIGSQKSQKEKLFSLISDEPLRSFKGLNFGYLPLDESKSIHFYFLDQEKEKYYYLWDLIVPHSLAVVIVCDNDTQQLLNENLNTINKLKNTYSTPFFICSLNNHENLMSELNQQGIDLKSDDRIFKFDNPDRDNFKELLTTVFSVCANELENTSL